MPRGAEPVRSGEFHVLVHPVTGPGELLHRIAEVLPRPLGDPPVQQRERPPRRWELVGQFGDVRVVGVGPAATVPVVSMSDWRNSSRPSTLPRMWMPSTSRVAPSRIARGRRAVAVHHLDRARLRYRSTTDLQRRHTEYNHCQNADSRRDLINSLGHASVVSLIAVRPVGVVLPLAQVHGQRVAAGICLVITGPDVDRPYQHQCHHHYACCSKLHRAQPPPQRPNSAHFANSTRPAQSTRGCTNTG
jgi:hypothetical protein